MKVFLVAGARPNFMKIAPLYREAAKRPNIECKIVHTGQHYDYDMSQTFFDDLDLPRPDYFMDAGSGTHAVQTAKIMVEFEKICASEKPEMVLVVGDVNSTLACSIVAKKAMIQVAHVEAGLRSFDLAMPEEINRMVTDVISDYFFVTEQSGYDNLVREGKQKDCIHLVGNVMVDNLFHQVESLKGHPDECFETFKHKNTANHYAFLTLHRPSNVDSRATFAGILAALDEIARERTIFFPMHPRTSKMIEHHELKLPENITVLKPLGFRDALFLWKDADIVLTDSGGLQEETTALGIPCVTIRENTERPITVDQGTNVLAGTTTEGILKGVEVAIQKAKNKQRVPHLWDGRAAGRIWDILVDQAAKDLPR